MRLCRYQDSSSASIAFFDDERILPLPALARSCGLSSSFTSVDLLDYLPPRGPLRFLASEIASRATSLSDKEKASVALSLDEVQLLVPVPQPNKVLLLAGNYAEHVREGGDRAEEREQTFPYFFWKPPTTTLTHPGDPVRIPACSPDHVDWEIELAVIIGEKCKDVSEEDALRYVAGYSVCVDVSDRKMQINPKRTERARDRFFDWLHGKWHDTFLPMGPCILSASDVDPQSLSLTLKVNGEVMQDSSTAQMIFPVAALVSILSTFVTLEPGDIISTGTPSGVGSARKPPRFLKDGDVMEAEIGQVGLLRNPISK